MSDSVSHSELKEIKDGAEIHRLLMDSALLLEINRIVLHPYGLALGIEIPPKGKTPTGKLRLFTTEDPEGINFAQDQLDEGMRRFKTWKDSRREIVKLREKLGYLYGIQPLTVTSKA